MIDGPARAPEALPIPAGRLAGPATLMETVISVVGPGGVLLLSLLV